MSPNGTILIRAPRRSDGRGRPARVVCARAGTTKAPTRTHRGPAVHPSVLMVIDDATLTSSERESKLVHRTRHASDIHCILLDGGGG